MIAFVDTNVLIRHLTGDPPEMAVRATAALRNTERLLLTDVVFAECIYVLEAFYEVPRERVAELLRAALAAPTISTVDPGVLLRALEIYERDRIDFAEAHLAAGAEATGVGNVLTFARSVERVRGVHRWEP